MTYSTVTAASEPAETSACNGCSPAPTHCPSQVQRSCRLLKGRHREANRLALLALTTVTLSILVLPLAHCWPGSQPLPSGWPLTRRLLSDSTLEATLDARQALKAKVDSVAIYNTIILTQANCGYLAFAENWLYHVAKLNITNFLVISEDDAATAYLEERYAGHTVSSALLDSTRAHLTLNEDKFQNFGSDSFIQLACARPVYLAAVLSMGFNVLWIDLDAALLIDPFKYIPWLYEYVGVDDHLAGKGRDSDYLCTCFMFLRPTDSVRELLSEWESLCEQRGGPTVKPGQMVGNQMVFNRVMRSRQNATVALDYYVLPKQLYPDGWHMRRDKGEGCGNFWRSPAWSHANYISGFDQKREHFISQGIWHGGLADSAPQC